MSNYVVATNFGAKDALPSGNPAKLILGAQLTTEFNNIATAIATKFDGSGPIFGTTGVFSGLVQAQLGLQVTGAAFTSRGITDNATANALTIASTGAITLPTPGSAVTPLTVSGATNAVTAFIQGNTTGPSFGVRIQAGTSSSDLPLQVRDAANSTNFFLIAGDGGVTVGGATGGNQGPGTLNAVGLYTNGGQLFFGVPSSLNVTAALADVGKCIVASGNIAINNAVFSQGNAFSIYNNTAGSITINGTLTTMRLAGTATTGNRTLAARGMATVWMNSSTEGVVGGPGVT